MRILMQVLTAFLQDFFFFPFSSLFSHISYVQAETLRSWRKAFALHTVGSLVFSPLCSSVWPLFMFSHSRSCAGTWEDKVRKASGRERTRSHPPTNTSFSCQGSWANTAPEVHWGPDTPVARGIKSIFRQWRELTITRHRRSDFGKEQFKNDARFRKSTAFKTALLPKYLIKQGARLEKEKPSQ